MSLILTSISSTPWLEMISNEGMARSRTSTSTMRWSSLPSRSCARSFSRVRFSCSRLADSAAGFAGSRGAAGAGGSNRSSTRSSADCSARSATSSSFSSRTMSMAVSMRSRTMDSTSRPTYPTSVYFEASTLTNGQPARRARRRAISVFPTPVGPIMRMFFGKTSSAISGGSFWRRTRLRNATATARLAAACPTMYLSSSRTISRGVQSVRSAGPDGHQAVIRLDDVPVAGKYECPFGVSHDEQCFEVPQRAVFAPFLGQFHGCLLQIAGELLKFPFEAFKKRNCIGSRTGEAGDDFVIEEAPRFARGVLHHVIAHGHLSVGDEHNLIVPAHAQHRSAVHLRASLAIPHPAIIPPRESERQNPVKAQDYSGGL